MSIKKYIENHKKQIGIVGVLTGAVAGAVAVYLVRKKKKDDSRIVSTSVRGSAKAKKKRAPVKKKAPAKRKAAPKRRAPAKKKAAPKKKVAPKRKASTKKRAAPKRKAPARKKAAKRAKKR